MPSDLPMKNKVKTVQCYKVNIDFVGTAQICNFFF